MAKLLEIRDVIVHFYSKFYIYINILLKFILATVVLMTIENNLGYMTKLNSIPIIMILAVICCLLPMNATVWVSGLLILLNLFALSKEAAAVCFLLFIVIYFMYFRFCPKDNVIALLSPILCKYGIPYVSPIVSGLVRPVYSAISIVCGTVTFYFLEGVKSNAALLTSVANKDTKITDKLTVLLGILTDSKEMYAVIIAMVFTSIVVYFIRQLKVDYAWIIALVAGILLQVVSVIVCCVVMSVSPNAIGLAVGSVLAAVIGVIIIFFYRNLDYARVENVQYEDDEYYYYVKAVPKKYVGAKEVSVKQFGNTGRMPRTPQAPTGDTTVLDRKALAQELDIDENLLN